MRTPDGWFLPIAVSAILVASIIGFVTGSTSAGEEGRKSGDEPGHAKEPAKADLHADYDKLLGETVKDGRVDYAALKKRVKRLDAYLAALDEARPRWMARSARVAFWINAYNAFTLRLIVRSYPGIKSIRDLEEPWKQRVWKAAGRTWSLDQIEHEVLRKEFEEPRIHFALVCAAKSCPPLSSRAYRGATLDAQLDAVGREFLGDPKTGFRRVEGDKPAVLLSRIFEWYGKDFEKSGLDLLTALAPFLTEQDRAFVKKHRARLAIRWLDYDWSLNGG